MAPTVVLETGEPPSEAEKGVMEDKTELEPTISEGYKTEEEVKDLYTHLVTEGPYVPGDSCDFTPIEEIPWVDKELIEHNIGFHRKYLTFALLSTTFALLYGFAVKPNSAVLVRTGKLYDPELSFQRYLATIQRIGKFFMLPFDQVKSYKALNTVRKMHVLASKKRKKYTGDHQPLPPGERSEQWKTELAEAMRKDLSHIDTSGAPSHLLTWDPPVPMSQFDMAITQFGFVGTMWVFPHVFGIKDREEEMKGMVHTWAVFGRLLGIRDEFNICIRPDSSLYDLLFRNVVLESLKTMDETVITIQDNFIKAFRKRLPFMTYKSMLFFGLREVKGYTGEELWKLMSWGDKLSFKILSLWVWAIRTSLVYRYFTHFVTVIWVQIQCWIHLPTSLWD